MWVGRYFVGRTVMPKHTSDRLAIAAMISKLVSIVYKNRISK